MRRPDGYMIKPGDPYKFPRNPSGSILGLGREPDDEYRMARKARLDMERDVRASRIDGYAKRAWQELPLTKSSCPLAPATNHDPHILPRGE